MCPAKTTDAAGFYSAPNLLPGPYEVTAAASGFSTTRESDITLTVGAQQVLNLLGLQAEFIRAQTRRLPNIAKRRGAFEGGVRLAADQDGEPFALRWRRSEVTLLVFVELPIKRSFRT